MAFAAKLQIKKVAAMAEQGHRYTSYWEAIV
jgi:hypothetical protein